MVTEVTIVKFGSATMTEIGQQVSHILLDQFLEVALIGKVLRTLIQVISTLI